MKHLIIGSGIVGEATGILLKAHEEEICFYDKNKKVLDRLKEKTYPIVYDKKDIDYSYYNLIWICTAEWNVDEVMEDLNKKARNNTTIIIRSTTAPGTVQTIVDKYKHFIIAHVPEFLKAKTHIEDTFNPDRIIIGTNNIMFGYTIRDFFMLLHPDKPVLVVSSTESELIKLASNSWLATQISYWNEILRICKLFKANSQMVANGCTLDHRISNYGTKMIDEAFGGFCLPKDLVTLRDTFKDKKITSEFLKMVSEINKKTKVN